MNSENDVQSKFINMDAFRDSGFSIPAHRVGSNLKCLLNQLTEAELCGSLH